MSKQQTRLQIVNKTAGLMRKTPSGEHIRELLTSHSPEIHGVFTTNSQSRNRKHDTKKPKKRVRTPGSTPTRGTRRERILVSGLTVTEEQRLQAQEKLRILVWRLGVVSETLRDFEGRMTALICNLEDSFRHEI